MTTTTARARWLDADQPLDQRVELLLAELTVEEKAGQLHLGFELDPVTHHDEIAGGRVGAGIYSHGANAVPGSDADRAGQHHRRLPAGRARRSPGWASRCCSAVDVVHGLRTTFPIPLGLVGHLGRRPGPTQCAAQSAARPRPKGFNLTFAPMIDISSEHRWGRIGETFGDEPLLAGRLGAATVDGFQSGGRFAATAKHFCGYGLVQAERDSRDPLGRPEHPAQRAPASVPGRRRGRGPARSWSASTTSTAYRCTPTARWSATCSRIEWGFSGVVVSDWDGIGQLVHQGVASDRRDAARQAMLAGVDLDMVSGAYREYLPGLIASGEIGSDLLDDAVRRVLRLKLRVGLFDQPDRIREPDLGPPAPARPAAALARQAAASSVVLLKNTGILPLHSNLGRRSPVRAVRRGRQRPARHLGVRLGRPVAARTRPSARPRRWPSDSGRATWWCPTAGSAISPSGRPTRPI